MKKNIIKLIVILLVALSFNSSIAFADNITDEVYIEADDKENSNDPEKKAYQEKAKVIKDQIKAVNDEIKTIKESTNTIRTKFAKIIKDKKKNGTTTISEENLKKARELRKSIQKKEKKEASLDSETSVQKYVKNKDYENALIKLNSNLEKKKEELTYQKSVNEIWKQIDTLIS